MISAPLIALALIVQPPEGTIVRRTVVSEVVRCDDCGVRITAVESAIHCLATSPRDGDREAAARALRLVKWTCHPEIVPALANALCRDPDWCVREEAAESLTKLGACDPEAHAALARAAVRDPKLCVRLQARKGLKALSGRCDGDCSICDASTTPIPTRFVGPPRPLGPIRSLIPSIDIAGPGVRMHLGPRRYPVAIGPPVVVEPPVVVAPPIISKPAPDAPPPEPLPAPLRDREIRSVPRDELTPSDPTPPPSSSALPDPLPEPLPTPSRRSSSKPVSPTPRRPSAPAPKPIDPDAGIPPLVGPAGSPG
jgi:hypothetical protein